MCETPQILSVMLVERVQVVYVSLELRKFIWNVHMDVTNRDSAKVSELTHKNVQWWGFCELSDSSF